MQLNHHLRHICGWLGIVLLASCMLVLPGCPLIEVKPASIDHLREAQDSFNKAAALENSNRLRPLAPNSADEAGNNAQGYLAELNAIKTGYGSALLSLRKIDEEEQQELRANGLWGVKLTLEALVQWRLGHYDEALVLADMAIGRGEDQVFPRDRAVIAALPGLIKIDLAYRRILDLQPGDERTLAAVRERLVGTGGAVEDIHRARRMVNANHEVNVHLILSQLAAFRNYQQAYKIVFTNTLPRDDPARKEARHNLFELQKLIDRVAPGSSVVRDWQNNYNINPVQRNQTKDQDE